VDYSHVKVDAFVPQNFDGEFIFVTDAPSMRPMRRPTPPLRGRRWKSNIKISSNIFALFVQDEWRVSPYLTLNVGLRWDYEDQVYVKHDWQNFGPRVHFAWDATKDGKTSVRGGFGIYYDQVFLNVPLLAELFAPGRFTSTTILFRDIPIRSFRPPGDRWIFHLRLQHFDRGSQRHHALQERRQPRHPARGRHKHGRQPRPRLMPAAYHLLSNPGRQRGARRLCAQPGHGRV
jgi:hypothetical protein